MMDLVYVLGSGSRHADWEIVQSMRLMKKFAVGMGEFYVVGEIPRTVPAEHFHHIRCEDRHGFPAYNTRLKVTKACQTAAISDTFLLLNDDFFARADFTVGCVPRFSGGSLAETIAHREHNPNRYWKTLVNTAQQLKARKLPTRDFELHVPMPIHKETFREMVDAFDWTDASTMPLWRSCYGNFCTEPGQPLRDMKVDEPLTAVEFHRRLEGCNFFSIGEGALAGGEIRSYIEKL